MADVEKIAAELRAGLDGVTRGDWQVVEIRHSWTLPPRPEHGETETKQGEHIERTIATTWDHPQTHAPWPIAMVAHGITNEPGKVVYFLAIEEADAAHIARCHPENIRALLDELSRLREVERMAKEATRPFLEVDIALSRAHLQGHLGGGDLVLASVEAVRVASDLYRALSTQVEERE